ncbi:MAG: YeiH family protein [Caulobacteraceae bacterium]
MVLDSSSRAVLTVTDHPAAKWIYAVAPGLALCCAAALASIVLQGLEQRLFGRAWLESLVLAILVGAAVRGFWTPPAVCRAGIAFGARTLLEVAVMLLGASVSAATLMSLGWNPIVGIVVIVLLAISASFGLGRALRLPRRMALLVACGNSICGNSAIVAVAPVIGADGQDITAAIAFTGLLGVVTILILPLAGAALHLGAFQFGVLSGLTVYAVPQVLAAAAAAGPVAVQVGTLVKLARVLMLGPVCFIAALLARRWTREDGVTTSGLAHKAPSLWKLAPWFIIGFLALAALRTLGALPSIAIEPAAAAASALTIVSMAALGLCTDLRCAAKAGPRVAAAVTLSLLVLGAMSLGLIAMIWR